MPGISAPAVRHVVSGTYQRALSTVANASWTAETEQEVTLVATNIVASGQDELFSWIRGEFYIWDFGTAFACEYMLIKCQATDALQDLNDSAVIERLHKESRLFLRGLLMNPLGSYARVKPLKFELFEVKLNDGEELRLVLRPALTGGAGDGKIFGLLEWRKVGA